ncbi:MAG: AAA family ATPase [Silvanigrellaceae bacterium]
MITVKPWADSLRPTVNTIEQLQGPAKRIWERDLNRWRDGHRAHLVFWGPPGCGKTTLALLLCESQQGLPLRKLSAVRDGASEIKKAIDSIAGGGILFIDEIHRLTRPQQDILLPTLESGDCWLVAATTENPAAVLSPALLSRIRTLRVHPLGEAELHNLLIQSLEQLDLNQQKNLSDDKRLRMAEKWLPLVAKRADGDARLALNILDGLLQCEDEIAESDLLTGQLKAWTSKTHHDYASAMIKSMRGSDPDAALFYANAALESGENPAFLLRRCIIFASEDIGNADPQALRIAIACAEAFEKVGMPEGRYAIAQTVCYLSSTAKSNRLLRALNTVSEWWNKASSTPRFVAPPSHLILKGHEKYRYPHNYPQSFVREQYLPDEIEKYRQTSGPAYLPSDEGLEVRLKERLKSLWNR